MPESDIFVPKRIQQLEDPDRTARMAGTWAVNTLQKVIFYRKQSKL